MDAPPAAAPDDRDAPAGPSPGTPAAGDQTGASSPIDGLEAELHVILAGPEADHERRVEELCRRHPEHAALLWRWLAVARGDDREPALPAFVTGVPERLGHFVLRERLGEGGMGAVFAAEDERTGRRVALKIIRLDLLHEERTRRRFQREIQALSRVDSPAVCAVYEVGEDAGIPFIAMRLVPGEDLARRLRRARSLGNTSDRSPRGFVVLPGSDPHARAADLDAVLAFGESVARALHLVHTAGLVHRDVKPANVMLTDAGQPVLLDFGVVRDAAGGMTGASLSAEVVGTVEYMAPEQVRAGGVDARADVYALGATLFECVTLRAPFTGRTRDEVFEQILRTEAPLATHLNRHVPRDVARIVARCLEKDRSHRYADALALAEDLHRARVGEPVRARPVGLLRRTARWADRNPLAALLILSISVGLALALWLSRERSVALGAERSARSDATKALADFQLLKHGVRLNVAREHERELYPPWPEKTADLEAWIRDEAEPLELVLPDLRDKLAGLRRRGTAGESRDAWLFADDSEQFLHDTLGRLVAELETFAGDGGLLARARQRLDWSRGVEELSLRRPAEAWARCLDAVRHDERFAGVELEPWIGLAPLGPDPESGLQEFADLRSGTAPVRGADGKLALTEESGIVLVLLPGGRFLMGAQRDDPRGRNHDPWSNSSEQPVQSLVIRPFLLARFELTQAQWQRLSGGHNPSYYRPGPYWGPPPYGCTLQNPVESVSSEECELLLRQNGMELPTEAQWEYACRAGTTTPWWTGAEPESLMAGGASANVLDRSTLQLQTIRSQEEEAVAAVDDGFPVTSPIGRFRPNRFGLHDTIGNVAEWCRDGYVFYQDSPAHTGDGYRRSAPGSARTCRGGGFSTGLFEARSATRGAHTGSDPGVGVRAARMIPWRD